jgi:hypothetical protein
MERGANNNINNYPPWQVLWAVEIVVSIGTSTISSRTIAGGAVQIALPSLNPELDSLSIGGPL